LLCFMPCWAFPEALSCARLLLLCTAAGHTDVGASGDCLLPPIPTRDGGGAAGSAGGERGGGGAEPLAAPELDELMDVLHVRQLGRSMTGLSHVGPAGRARGRSFAVGSLCTFQHFV
jgi:hypothetical protein